DYMVALKNAVVGGTPEANRRAMLAEIGFTNVTPSVFTQLYPRNAADLWLPMSADHDTEFEILSPAPKDANSVLGLLLRNSPLRIAGAATNESAGLGAGQPVAEVARTTPVLPIANLPAAAGHAAGVISGFSAEASVVTPESRAAGPGKDLTG